MSQLDQADGRGRATAPTALTAPTAAPPRRRAAAHNAWGGSALRGFNVGCKV